MCIDILQQGAWIEMGLRADPITQDVEADLMGFGADFDQPDFRQSDS